MKYIDLTEEDIRQLVIHLHEAGNEYRSIKTNRDPNGWDWELVARRMNTDNGRHVRLFFQPKK